jgi:hypothetical protein
MEEPSREDGKLSSSLAMVPACRGVSFIGREGPRVVSLERKMGAQRRGVAVWVHEDGRGEVVSLTCGIKMLRLLRRTCSSSTPDTELWVPVYAPGPGARREQPAFHFFLFSWARIRRGRRLTPAGVVGVGPGGFCMHCLFPARLSGVWARSPCFRESVGARGLEVGTPGGHCCGR